MKKNNDDNRPSKEQGSGSANKSDQIHRKPSSDDFSKKGRNEVVDTLSPPPRPGKGK